MIKYENVIKAFCCANTYSLIVCFLFLGCSSNRNVKQIDNVQSNRNCDLKSTEFKKLVALGESTTAGGWSTSRDRCWVSCLGALINDFQSTPVEVFNAGIGANVLSSKAPIYRDSGKPAADIRLQKHVIDEKPDLLVISYGMNDARGGTPIPLFKNELIKLIDRVREVNDIDPLIVLLGPYYMTHFTSSSVWGHATIDVLYDFNECIKEVAAEYNCLFVDLLDTYGGTDWMVHYDGIHANDLGHRIIANQIFEVLARHSSGLAKHTKKLEKTSPRWRDESCLKLDFRTKD